MSPPLYGRLDYSLDGETVDAELNVGMSKGLRGAVSAPSGVQGGAPEQKYVSKITHGFFITITSMILYFKHIIHIDDFPLYGHPPSYLQSG